MKAVTRFAIFLAAIGLTLAAVVWWTSLSRSETSTPGSGSFDSTDVVQQYEPQNRRPLTPFTAQLLDGTELDSDDLRGRPVVVNVWGSWCGPCRAEAPILARVARDFEGRVRFLGLNVRDSPDAARAFERAFEVPYPSVHPDDSARAILAFGGSLTATAVPTTVVLDGNGRIAARVVGQVDGSTLRGLVNDVLQSSATPSDGSSS
ncbi:TlpA family protein disulfide reductase [Nocardioidaceae bacterium]|nr:TlpA family protein disulfide reductase [Nocardioidaceae bacterium]